MATFQDRALNTVKVEVTSTEAAVATSPSMRKHLILENRGSAKCYISFGTTPITSTDNCHELKNGDRWDVMNPGTCEIRARTISGTCDLIVSEG